MKLALFGENRIDYLLNEFIKIYNSIPSINDQLEILAVVEAFHCDNELPDLPLIGLGDFLQLYHSGDIDGLLIPREHFAGTTNLLTLLTNNGLNIENVYISKRLNEISEALKNTNAISIIDPYLDSSHLPYLEFHVADHCNLNCIACEHYSGLMKEKKFTNFDSWKKDMEKLHENIEDIGTIRLLGGEPLLHEDLDKFLIVTRGLYPYSNIMIVTNALLVKSMPQKLIDAIHKNNISIYISFYPPLEKKMPEIEAFLQENNINYAKTPLIKQFTKKQVLTPHNSMKESFDNCAQSHCNNLYEGKIAACFLPFTTHYFNEYFDKNIPETGALNLYEDDISTRKIKEHLLTPWDRCCYCDQEEPIDWGVVKHPSSLNQWTKTSTQYI